MPMASKDWHPGKLVMMWVVSLYLVLAASEEVGNGIVGGLFALVSLFGLVVAFVITWKWFTAREKKLPPDE